MSKCNCYECNPYGEPEQDQIDMMGADELRSEFRILLKQRDELLATLEKSHRMFAGIRNYTACVDTKPCRVATKTCEDMINEIDAVILNVQGDKT